MQIARVPAGAHVQLQAAFGLNGTVAVAFPEVGAALGVAQTSLVLHAGVTVFIAGKAGVQFVAGAGMSLVVPEALVGSGVHPVVAGAGHHAVAFGQSAGVLDEEAQVIGLFAERTGHVGVGTAGAVLVVEPVHTDGGQLTIGPSQLTTESGVAGDAIGVAPGLPAPELAAHDDVLVAAAGVQADLAHERGNIPDLGAGAEGIAVGLAGIKLQAGKLGLTAGGIAEQFDARVLRGSEGQVHRCAATFVPGAHALAGAILVVVTATVGKDGAQRHQRVASAEVGIAVVVIEAAGGDGAFDLEGRPVVGAGMAHELH